jgi:uncharacterized membrane protein
MSLTPLLNASFAVQLHAVGAIVALFLGAYIFFNPKGTPVHRLLGKIWVVSMAVAVFSSAFIFEIRVWGVFSPIHLLTAFSAVSLVVGVWAARTGRIALHQRSMLGLYVGGLFIAGTFTFLPNRIMNHMFFGGQSMAGFYLVAAVAVVAGILVVRKNAPRRRKMARP